MSTYAIAIRCPSCGAPIDTNVKVTNCIYCGTAIVIKTEHASAPSINKPAPAPVKPTPPTPTPPPAPQTVASVVKQEESPMTLRRAFVWFIIFLLSLMLISGVAANIMVR